MPWFVYMLRCSDNSLYCGVTTDLPLRIAAHNAGNGASYTRCRLPVELEWHMPAASKSEAYSQECRIKKMRKSGKELLVASQRTEREGLIFQKSIDGLLILTDPRLKPSE